MPWAIAGRTPKRALGHCAIKNAASLCAKRKAFVKLTNAFNFENWVNSFSCVERAT